MKFCYISHWASFAKYPNSKMYSCFKYYLDPVKILIVIDNILNRIIFKLVKLFIWLKFRLLPPTIQQVVRQSAQYQLLELQNYIQILVPRMEEQQITVPITVTFQPQFTNNKQSTTQKPESTTINKHSSQPKFRTYKQEILKIPKVKQILNKDRYIYSQDMEKRLELIGTLKNDNYEQEEMYDLNDLRKKVDKKTKRHKTNFKIPLTRKNMQSLNNLILKNINHNQKFKNEEVIFLKEYTQNAPFDLDQLKFIDKIDQVKVKFSEKYPDLNQKVLSKNKLTLQNVILNRNIRRQIKLDNKKQQKLHSINVFSKLKTVDDPRLLVKESAKKNQSKNP